MKAEHLREKKYSWGNFIMNESVFLIISEDFTFKVFEIEK